jgi:hypothetical protein
VARAKRTDRAEARRKYRAYLMAQEEAEAAQAEDSDSSAGEAGSKPVRSRDPKPSPVVQPGARLGIVAAARAAYRTPHYIDDIRAIGPLIFRSNAVWPVLALCVVAGAYFAVRVGSNDYGSDPILPFLYQFLFYPVPLLPPMLAGFLAPRSTWLAGLIASFIGTMTLVVVVGLNSGKFTAISGTISGASASPTVSSSVTVTVSTAPGATALVTSTPTSGATAASSGTPAASPTSGGTTGNTTGGTTTDLFTLAVTLLAQSLAFGALMGALSGWYKRFLALTSGPRKPPASRSGSGRTPQRRRPATRS